jgi:hypothetical protein
LDMLEPSLVVLNGTTPLSEVVHVIANKQYLCRQT